MNNVVPHDDCYRCGYDLHGIADQNPCPECGLLAERSRRTSDELHETRPKWLRSLLLGCVLILLAFPLGIAMEQLKFNPPLRIPGSAMVAMTAYSFWLNFAARHSPVLAGLISVSLGIFILTRREGYEPADQDDRWLRLWLRCAAFSPPLTLAAAFASEAGRRAIDFHTRSGQPFPNAPIWLQALNWSPLFLAAFGVAPLPILLSLRLRGLAKRARSAQMAEHSMIVGIGITACIVLLIILEIRDSPVSWVVDSTLIIASALFLVWSDYIFIRFAFALGNALRQLRRNWRRNDRAVTT